jgi:TonB family protein
MDFFDKHKALILTVLFCSVLVLALYNFSLSKKQQYTSEMLVSLEELKEEQIKEEEPEEEPREIERTNPNQTHRAFNEEEEAREENFNRRLNEIFDRNSAQQEETSESDSESASGNYKMNRNSTDSQKKQSHGENTSEAISEKTGGIRNSNISFVLKGRNAIHIPNPIYTCDRAGKVVVNIQVDANGRVTSASINKSSSSTNNECIFQNALDYARGAVFTELAGRNEQPGTITYHFQP